MFLLLVHLLHASKHVLLLIAQEITEHELLVSMFRRVTFGFVDVWLERELC